MTWTQFRYAVRARVKRLPVAIRDALRNRRHATADKRFLVVHHPGKHPFFYDIVLDWLAEHFPEVRARFEMRQIPLRLREDEWPRFVLHVPWLQDPVQLWSPAGYEQAMRIAAQCDRRGIPVINRVDRLLNASKSTAAALVKPAGVRTPRMARIDDRDAFYATRLGLPLPLIVREDWGHGGRVIRADTDEEVRRIPLRKFTRPVAVEFIDVRSDDGLYRKYRYVAAGDLGVPQSIHTGTHWMVKGAPGVGEGASGVLLDEEAAFTRRPDPHHAPLQAARRALGLDFVAFDYSIDRDGRLVVWEANPYPHLRFAKRRAARREATARVIAAMARLYLARAGLPVPAGIDAMLAGF